MLSFFCRYCYSFRFHDVHLFLEVAMKKCLECFFSSRCHMNVLWCRMMHAITLSKYPKLSKLRELTLSIYLKMKYREKLSCVRRLNYQCQCYLWIVYSMNITQTAENIEWSNFDHREYIVLKHDCAPGEEPIRFKLCRLIIIFDILINDSIRKLCSFFRIDFFLSLVDNKFNVKRFEPSGARRTHYRKKEREREREKEKNIGMTSLIPCINFSIPHSIGLKAWALIVVFVAVVVVIVVVVIVIVMSEFSIQFQG